MVATHGKSGLPRNCGGPCNLSVTIGIQRLNRTHHPVGWVPNGDSALDRPHRTRARVPPTGGVRRMETITAPVVEAAESSAANRWIGVGSSTETASRQAGIEAATAALRGPDPKLLVVFVSPVHDLQALLAGIRSVAPATPLIGCSTAGEIATDGPSDASVVVTAIGGAGYSVATRAARDASSDLRQAGATAATCAENGAAGDNQILLLLTDCLGGDQQEAVRGAYSVVRGAVSR